MADKSDVSENALCGICNNIVKSGENAIKCDGNCKKRYHTKCTKISDKDYVKLQKLEVKVLWLCPEDQMLYDRFINNNFDEMFKACEKSIRQIKDLLRRTELLTTKAINDGAGNDIPAVRPPGTGGQGVSNGPTRRRRTPADGNSGSPEDEDGWFKDAGEVLKYGAQHVIKPLAPVSLCMLVVVATINAVSFFSTKDVYLQYTPFHELSSDPGTKIWNALANYIIIMIFMTLNTILGYVLHKASYNKLWFQIFTCLLFSLSIMLIAIFSNSYWIVLLDAYNILLDYPTAIFLMWNFGVAGMMSVTWNGPFRLQQAYLIYMAALMALHLIRWFPEWTTWAVLAAIPIWHLIIVQSPNGPSWILEKTAQERDESVIFRVTSLTPQQKAQAKIDKEKKRLGMLLCSFNPHFLSAFYSVFYSMLAGKASSYGDWNTTIACFVAILIGLCLSILLRAIRRKFFSPIPIPIFFGLIFCFVTSTVVKPFMENLSAEQIFI